MMIGLNRSRMMKYHPAEVVIGLLLEAAVNRRVDKVLLVIKVDKVKEEILVRMVNMVFPDPLDLQDLLVSLRSRSWKRGVNRTKAIRLVGPWPYAPSSSKRKWVLWGREAVPDYKDRRVHWGQTDLRGNQGWLDWRVL
jgi:hypothetical protein